MKSDGDKNPYVNYSELDEDTLELYELLMEEYELDYKSMILLLSRVIEVMQFCQDVKHNSDTSVEELDNTPIDYVQNLSEVNPVENQNIDYIG